jgi:hypothetical protein
MNRISNHSRRAFVPLAVALSFACAMAVAGCRKDESAAETGGATGLRYDLVCDSSDTDKQSSLVCVRIDSANGDIKLLKNEKLPVLDGPTGAKEKPPGTYKVVCDSTDTPQHSEFHCLRIDRETGEVMVVRLPKMGTIPPR